jgi:DNA-directed RNA polymerase specialized sigma24 family protein
MNRETGAASGKDGMTGADEDFAEFARASYGGLRHAAYLLTGDRHVAEDAAQAALVRTYAAWSRVRRDDAYAYARKVLVNHVTDRWRRRLREYPAGELPDHRPSPDPADEVALRHWLTGALAAHSPGVAVALTTPHGKESASRPPPCRRHSPNRDAGI